MVEVLQNKNSSTRFQIMVEIAARGPNIQQKNIATKLNITPQAVSEYIGYLVDDGLVSSAGRSRYKVTSGGVNWMLKVLRELSHYLSLSEKAITSITVSTAIAKRDVTEGQMVGLKMEDGLLLATAESGASARGMVTSSVKAGEDVGVTKIEGLIELARGKISVLQVPRILKGGSRQVDLERLKSKIGDNQQVGAIGIEALIALRRVGIEPRYFYDVVGVAIDASSYGLPFIIVCTDDASPNLLSRLEEEGLEYTIINMSMESKG